MLIINYHDTTGDGSSAGHLRQESPLCDFVKQKHPGSVNMIIQERPIFWGPTN